MSSSSLENDLEHATNCCLESRTISWTTLLAPEHEFYHLNNTTDTNCHNPSPKSKVSREGVKKCVKVNALTPFTLFLHLLNDAEMQS